MPGVEDSGHEPYPMGIDLVKVCDICEASHYSPSKTLFTILRDIMK